MKPTPKTIIEDIEEYHGFPSGYLIEHTRGTAVTKARKLAIYLARKYTDWSSNEIGDVFHRDHSTILHAVRTFKDNNNLKYFENKYKSKWWKGVF